MRAVRCTVGPFEIAYVPDYWDHGLCNLDPHTAEAVEDLLLGLNRDSGTALIMVTHNEKLADRLRKRAYLVDGRLVS